MAAMGVDVLRRLQHYLRGRGCHNLGLLSCSAPARKPVGPLQPAPARLDTSGPAGAWPSPCTHQGRWAWGQLGGRWEGCICGSAPRSVLSLGEQATWSFLAAPQQRRTDGSPGRLRQRAMPDCNWVQCSAVQLAAHQRVASSRWTVPVADTALLMLHASASSRRDPPAEAFCSQRARSEAEIN